MWLPTLILNLLLLVSLFHGARGEQTSYRPQNCTLECIRRGDPRCEYCRISADDVQMPTSIPFSSPFGSIAFLRGFQVTLQALGGSQVLCQLFLLGTNLSLTPAHAQMVYHSDPFTHLSLDSVYVVTIMALPVPERWDKFYKRKQFFTRTCPEKNGLEECKKDWYPTYVEVHQENQDVLVTFNLAPENFKIQPRTSSLMVFLSVGILLAATTVLTVIVVYTKRIKKKTVQTKMRPEIIEQYYDKKLDEGQCVLLDRTTRPPGLLICYSIICSQGLLQNQNHQSEDEEPLENTASAIVSMIGEELCRAKALGRDLSKYMVATFEYSQESDIPAALGLASRYTLIKDLPLLFSHLHGVALQKPGVYLQVENISESGYCKLPAGAALQLAVQEATAQFSEEPTEEEHVGIPIIS
ncbi:Interleukin-17 receptor D [Labeo rohita]|uniref:Interleukin-17 receptor D n=1 Tax=Labeo rohita TaxID=84645 RepID=A0ABQ8LFT6_LABRO|nr:Interleukin-17 receptor D [Labeo rohita]